MMAFIFANEQHPRSLAEQLRKYLNSREGLSIKPTSALNLLAKATEHKNWADLKSHINPNFPSRDDEAAGFLETNRRRKVQVQALIDAGMGITPDAARRAVDYLRLTGAPRSPKDSEFEGRDDAVHEDGHCPRWHAPNTHPAADLMDIMATTEGPFLGYKDGENTLSEISRDEVISRATDGKPRSFEPIQNDELDAEAAALREKLRDPNFDLHEYWAQVSGGKVVYSSKGTRTVTHDRYDGEDDNARANALLQRGKAAEWAVYSVRSTRRAENGNWQAAPGRQLGVIVLQNGQELGLGTLTQLASRRICPKADTIDFEVVASPKGLVIRDNETREPRYMARRLPPPPFEQWLEEMKAAGDSGDFQTAIPLAEKINAYDRLENYEKTALIFNEWMTKIDGHLVKADIDVIQRISVLTADAYIVASPPYKPVFERAAQLYSLAGDLGTMEASFEAGMLYFSLGQHDAAKRNFAVPALGGHTKSRTNLAIMEAKDNRPDNAFKLLLMSAMENDHVAIMILSGKATLDQTDGHHSASLARRYSLRPEDLRKHEAIRATENAVRNETKRGYFSELLAGLEREIASGAFDMSRLTVRDSGNS